MKALKALEDMLGGQGKAGISGIRLKSIEFVEGFGFTAVFEDFGRQFRMDEQSLLTRINNLRAYNVDTSQE